MTKRKQSQSERLALFMADRGIDVDVPIIDMHAAIFGAAWACPDPRKRQQQVGAVITVLHRNWKRDDIDRAVIPGQLKHTYRLVVQKQNLL